jgi:hypothetical protein
MAHVILKMLFHIAALGIFLHAAVESPKEQGPDPKPYPIEWERRGGVQCAHESTGGYEASEDQVNKCFHKKIGLMLKIRHAQWMELPDLSYVIY